MSPLTNAVLGVLFLAIGAVATLLMFYLRGGSAGKTTDPAPSRTGQHRRDAEPPKTLRAPRPPAAPVKSPPPPPAPRPEASPDPTGRDAKISTAKKIWHKVAKPQEVSEGSLKAAQAGSRSVALSRLNGRYGAIDGFCSHQGGPLGEGTLEGDLLRCPWHGWGFHRLTGESSDPARPGIAAYEVESRDDGVYVAVEEIAESAPTVSDVMVQTMVNWGVRHVFGMVGHSNLALAEAVRKQEAAGNLQYIGIRHEGAASFACSAYAKLSGKPAACLTIAGPGATNLLTGLWDAHVDRAPLLALTGQVQTQILGPGAFQEIDQASAFKAVTLWSQMVLPTSQHAELMTLALKHATVQRGVAHLIFPDEVQGLPLPDAPASGPEGRLGRISILPAEESIQEAAALIAESRRPAIIAGYGARDSMSEIIQLAEELHAPVITTFKGKGQIPDDHPLAAGVLGRSGTPVASWCMSSADLLIVFGASFANHTGIDRTKPIIQVDFDRIALGKFHPVAVPLWGEIGVTARELQERLPEFPSAGDIRGELSDRWASWRAEKEKRASQNRGQGVSSAAIFAALARQAPENAAIAVDVGNNTYSFGRYFECKHQAILMSGYLGSIGFALPAALGAWAAAPDRPILSVSGDGGFAQYMGEFTTAVKYGMNITHVLLNNNELGKISKEQRDGRWPVWQTSLRNPDFSEYARLCGGHGVRVTKTEELDEALASAIAHDGPALVEILSDAELT